MKHIKEIGEQNKTDNRKIKARKKDVKRFSQKVLFLFFISLSPFLYIIFYFSGTSFSLFLRLTPSLAYLVYFVYFVYSYFSYFFPLLRSILCNKCFVPSQPAQFLFNPEKEKTRVLSIYSSSSSSS